MTSQRVGRLIPAVMALSAAAFAWIAPAASADVADVTIVPGLSGGPTTPFGTGCTYLVIARTADAPHSPSESGVGIVDLNQASTLFPQELIWDYIDPYYTSPVIFDHAFSLWTPHLPGEHAVMAFQTSAGGPVETVMVKSGTPIGPGCLVAP